MERISNSLSANPILLRACIQYEVLEQKPVFESYLRFCGKMGAGVIDYNEFEFWYFRFYNGQLDLDYDRSLSPQKVTFSTLPIEIVAEIVENLDPLSRIVIRNVSKTLRDVSDHQKVNFAELRLMPHPSESSLCLNGELVRFWNNDYGSGVDLGKDVIKVPGRNYLLWGINFIKPLITNPRVYTERLVLSGGLAQHFFQEFLCAFCDLAEKSPKLAVKHLELEAHRWVPVVRFIKLMEPGVLESIEIVQREKIFEVSKLFETEQFKQAKSIDISSYLMSDFSVVNLFVHLKSFKLTVQNIAAFQMLPFIETISKSEKFDNCSIRLKNELDLNDFARTFNEVVENQQVIHRYPILGCSSGFLLLDIQSHSINILNS